MIAQLKKHVYVQKPFIANLKPHSTHLRNTVHNKHKHHTVLSNSNSLV